MIYTFNEYHLGDNLIHLNYLRRACLKNPDKEFTHYCNPQYHPQLLPLIEGVPIELGDLHIHPKAVNAWIGANNFFYQHPQCRHWLQVHEAWFAFLSSILDISNPMASKGDYLFDYPALSDPATYAFEYLVINSAPMSNQLPDYNPRFFENIVRNLCNDGKKVVTTSPTGLCPCTLDHYFTVTDIGVLSKSVQHIIAVDTGPLWTTFNTHNAYSVLSRTIYGKTFDTIGLTANTVCYQKL